MLENIYSVLAPKGTPRPVINRLNALKALLLKQGVVPEPSTPDETKKIIQEDYE